jgi:plastocyanin
MSIGMGRRMMHWTSLLTFSVGTLLIVGRASPLGVAAAPAGTATAQVTIDHFSFSPPVMKVKPGTQITWTNNDDIPHTVVSDNFIFKSKVLATGEKFTFKASKPGVYVYSCSIHPNMTGKIIVQ